MTDVEWPTELVAELNEKPNRERVAFVRIIPKQEASPTG